jgi:hypothetical protein
VSQCQQPTRRSDRWEPCVQQRYLWASERRTETVQGVLMCRVCVRVASGFAFRVSGNQQALGQYLKEASRRNLRLWAGVIQCQHQAPAGPDRW